MFLKLTYNILVVSSLYETDTGTVCGLMTSSRGLTEFVDKDGVVFTLTAWKDVVVFTACFSLREIAF